MDQPQPVLIFQIYPDKFSSVVTKMAEKFPDARFFFSSSE